jgi:hypothetical protein
MNTLCPFIRMLKEIHAAKNTTQMKTISPKGDIAVDGFMFRESIWSKLIPRYFKECKTLLSPSYLVMRSLIYLAENTSCKLPKPFELAFVSQEHQGQESTALLVPPVWQLSIMATSYCPWFCALLKFSVVAEAASANKLCEMSTVEVGFGCS